MMKFSIKQLFPDFLLADRNGYAMAKAIERALQILCETVQEGIACIKDVDGMPEWRLDEMAWELNCLYDHGAAIEAKRRWIRDATTLYAARGTPSAITRYLDGFFDQVEIEEYWEYGGEPFHFRVTVSGELNEANEAWMHSAIERSKNVRSVLDGTAVGSATGILVRAHTEAPVHFPYRFASDELLAGTLDEEA